MNHLKSVMIVIFLVLLMQASWAQWSTYPKVNLAIADEPYAQGLPRIVSDGKGGAIIVWVENRGSYHADIYAQRVDRYGFLLWPDNPGVPVCTAFFDQNIEAVLSDGFGGVIVTWQDFRNAELDTLLPGYMSNEIYVQRIDSSGVALWQHDGILVRSESLNLTLTYNVHIVADGLGGAYLVWKDFRDGDTGNPDVYAQRVDYQGQLKWQIDGIPVNNPENIGRGSAVVPDSEGGMLVFYHVKVAGENIPTGQRIDSTGQFLWERNALRRNVGGTAVTDGTGGAILVGVDYDSIGNVLGLESQRINNLGLQLWGDGIRFGPADRRTFPFVTSDDSGGILVSWTLLQTTGERFVQRMDSTGTVQWRVDAIPGKEAITSDLEGGAIVLYTPYAQRIDSTGNLLWLEGGVIFRFRDEFFPSGSGAPLRMTTDGNGGAIIVWDERPYLSAPPNIYAQQISRNGKLGEVITSVESHTKDDNYVSNQELAQNYPNPFNSETKIEYKVNQMSQVYLSIIDIIGREVITLVNKKQYSGHYFIVWNGKSQRGGEVASGVYFCQIRIGDEVHVRKLLLLR